MLHAALLHALLTIGIVATLHAAPELRIAHWRRVRIAVVIVVTIVVLTAASASGVRATSIDRFFVLTRIFAAA
jgi:hypothetical protein